MAVKHFSQYYFTVRRTRWMSQLDWGQNIGQCQQVRKKLIGHTLKQRSLLPWSVTRCWVMPPLLSLHTFKLNSFNTKHKEPSITWALSWKNAAWQKSCPSMWFKIVWEGLIWGLKTRDKQRLLLHSFTHCHTNPPLQFIIGNSMWINFPIYLLSNPLFN